MRTNQICIIKIALKRSEFNGYFYDSNVVNSLKRSTVKHSRGFFT